MRNSVNPFINFLNNLVFRGLEVFGLYYSNYRGIVADNKDPEVLCRLKLIIPQVTGHDIHDYWSFPKAMYSGIEFGAQCIPQTGEMVWVEFEGGNPEVPIWSHGHRSKQEVPKDKLLRDINTFWFKSPGGSIILFNDTKNNIQIKLSNGNYFEINLNSVSVISDKAISLGKLDKSDYSAVLGEVNNEILDEILNTLISGKVIASGSPSPFSPDDIAKFSAIRGKLPTILSKKVTLD